MTEFRVELEVFSGPLDLLLTLVRREALDITTVTLARVTGSYLRYLAALEEIDPGALASFLEVGAALLVLKSRAILPQSEVRRTDLDDEDDPEALAERLRAYRHYRSAAEDLGQREREGLRAFVRVAPLPELPPAPGDASVSELAEAFERALAEAASRVEPAPAPGVRPPRIRLADRMVEIRRLLDRGSRLAFREALLGDRRDREFVIVSFLAVLELLRRGVIRVAQEDVFAEIVLELRPEAREAAWTPEELTAGVGAD